MQDQTFDGQTFYWERQKTSDLHDILIINGKYIHSKFNPIKEADDFIHNGPHLFVIFGLGFAYHINNILKNNPAAFFIIYEPLPSIYNQADDYLDYSIINKLSDKFCLINRLDQQEIFNFVKKFYIITESHLYTYSNLGYRSLFPELEKQFFYQTKKAVENLVQNILTEANFVPLWTKNFLYNCGQFDRNPFINIVSQPLDRQLAVIACAGPGLIHDLPMIKVNRSRITLFSLDTAYKSLISYGIEPDFVITLDGQYYSLEDYPRDSSLKTAIIMDAISYPAIGRKHPHVFFTLTQNFFTESIIEYFFQKQGLPSFGYTSGGTVADYTLSIAINFGFTHIYFAGLDLSFPHFQTHCRNTPFYNRALYTAYYYNTLESIMLQAIIKRSCKEFDSRCSGEKVFSDFILQNYAFFLSDYARLDPSIKFYYSPYSGIIIPHFIKIKLEELLISIDSRRFFWSDLIQHTKQINISHDQVLLFMNHLVKLLHIKTVEINKLITDTDFNSVNSDRLNEWHYLFNNLFNELPFLKKFIIMTEVILQKKNISNLQIIWYKHTGYKMLQSLYYIIRIIQKTIIILNH